MNSEYGGKMINKPSLVESHNVRFLIMDAPSEFNLPVYIEMLKKKHVSVVVRACEPTYNVELLESSGIHVVGAAFNDGEAPTSAVVDTWLKTLKSVFPHVYGSGVTSGSSRGNNDAAVAVEENPATKDKTTVAIHCIAGLGRAPILVAIGLMEAGMTAQEAIALVRSKRRGAFNSKQIRYLTQEYTPKSYTPTGCCVLM